MKFSEKNIENWQSWKMTFFLGGHFEFFFSRFFFFLLHLIKKTKGFHMRYNFFLYYGWFLNNIRKDFIRTNMHTTVCRFHLISVKEFLSQMSTGVGRVDNNGQSLVIVVCEGPLTLAGSSSALFLKYMFCTKSWST
jgi:hypothetical protein